MRVATVILRDCLREPRLILSTLSLKSVKRYGMSSDETASKLPVSWEEITKAEAMEVEAEVEVDQVLEETLTQNQRK